MRSAIGACFMAAALTVSDHAIAQQATDPVITGVELGRIVVRNFGASDKTKLWIRRCGSSNDRNYLRFNGKDEFKLKRGEVWSGEVSAGCYRVTIYDKYAQISERDHEVGVRPSAQGELVVWAGKRAPGMFGSSDTLEFKSETVHFGNPY